MDAPRGYPPPTLVRKKSGGKLVRVLIVLLVAGLLAGIWSITNFIDSKPVPPPVAAPEAEPATVAIPDEPESAGNADTPAAALPDTATTQPVTVETAVDIADAAPSPDARQPNRWYYVASLGDGPGAIYSRTGGAWNFALACNARAKTIEFIAVGTGTPDTDKPSIGVGSYKLMMDAVYSKDGGGTISTVLPAKDPFFTALDGSAPMEIQLLATRKTVVPVGPDVVRLVKTCRGPA